MEDSLAAAISQAHAAWLQASAAVLQFVAALTAVGLTVWVARKAPMDAQREMTRREHTTERRVAAIARRELDHHGAQLEGIRAKLLEHADDPLRLQPQDFGVEHRPLYSIRFDVPLETLLLDPVVLATGWGLHAYRYVAAVREFNRLLQYGRENPEHQTQNDLRDRESTLRNFLAEARASLMS